LKVSIITVCKNAALTLPDTLKSVATQSWDQIEHIIIDGASTDETAAIVSAYPHVSIYISEPDEGVYFAMNRGISLASGEIIGILNADDFYADSFVIEKVVTAFRHHKCEAVYGNLNVVDPKNTSVITRKWIAGVYKADAFYNGWSPPHPTFFLSTSLYKQYGCFDTRFSIAADYELMLRMLFLHRVNACYLDILLVIMRAGGLSNRSFRSRWIANREDRQAWEVNGLKPHLFTLILKPLTKIKQFIFKWQK
jgi:glycosyltransferase